MTRTADDGAAASSFNVQDVFLNGARRERLAVTILLTDGSAVDATIKSFDRFAIVVDHAGVDHLIFKHAIALIRPAETPGQAPTS